MLALIKQLDTSPAFLTGLAGLRRQLSLLGLQEVSVRVGRAVQGYEVIDFVAVLSGYAVSSEHTLEAFYEYLQPFDDAFMALFGRARLPARSTLSRFLLYVREENQIKR